MPGFLGVNAEQLAFFLLCWPVAVWVHSLQANVCGLWLYGCTACKPIGMELLSYVQLYLHSFCSAASFSPFGWWPEWHLHPTQMVLAAHYACLQSSSGCHRPSCSVTARMLIMEAMVHRSSLPPALPAVASPAIFGKNIREHAVLCMLSCGRSCRDVGSMDTHHHTVAVRIKSVLDSCDDMKDGDEDMQELEGSQQVGGAYIKRTASCLLAAHAGQCRLWLHSLRQHSVQHNAALSKTSAALLALAVLQISGMMDALVGGEDEAGGGGDEQLAGQDGRAAAACNNPKARAEGECSQARLGSCMHCCGVAAASGLELHFVLGRVLATQCTLT